VHSGDFVRDFALIMVAAAAALILFRLIRQPPILGYLLAGVLVGPFALQGRFVAETDTVSLVAEVGLVVLLFAIGVEFGWERIRKVGFRVVVIGAVEITAMISLGYFLGRALGWSPTTSIYLGAALAFSSSAVLVQILRENGQLMSLRGQLVVGVLVVEDFVAVVLLAVFAGYANQEDGGAVEVWPIVIKMAVFAVGALVFGTLLAPRLMDLLDYLKSRETLLIGSLGMCFGVGLLAREMGLSAGAGAFLIGTVLGDTRHRDQIARLIAPVRDVFAALFFVSIGMLVNMGEVPEYIGTALIVTGVLVAGKVLAASIGTFLTGHDGDTSLRVGTSMPQLGEFSLAIARSGSEIAAVGAQLYPVVTISTLMSSFIYPLVFKSSGVLGSLISWLVPVRVKEEAAVLSASIATARRAMAPAKPAPHDLVRGVRSAAVSFGIIGLVIVAGVLISNAGRSLASEIGLPEDLVGAAIVAAVVTLAVPAGIVLWRVLSDLGSVLARRAFIRFKVTSNLHAADVVGTSVVGVLLLIAGVWLVTQLLVMMPVADMTSPVPALVMVLSAAVTATAAMKIHSQMDKTFRRTLLGDVPEGAGSSDGIEAAGD
jgi:monovalent cation:H+ antiporter-2, CPA2 family